MNTIIITFFLSCLYGIICTSDHSAFISRSCSTDSNQASLADLIRNTDSPKSVLEMPKSSSDIDQNECQDKALKSCLKSVPSIYKIFQEPVLDYFTREKYSSGQLECTQNKVRNSGYSRITADLKEGFAIKKEEALLRDWIKTRGKLPPYVREKVWQDVIRGSDWTFEELGFLQAVLAKKLNITRAV